MVDVGWLMAWCVGWLRTVCLAALAALMIADLSMLLADSGRRTRKWLNSSLGNYIPLTWIHPAYVIPECCGLLLHHV